MALTVCAAPALSASWYSTSWVRVSTEAVATESRHTTAASAIGGAFRTSAPASTPAIPRAVLSSNSNPAVLGGGRLTSKSRCATSPRLSEPARGSVRTNDNSTLPDASVL